MPKLDDERAAEEEKKYKNWEIKVLEQQKTPNKKKYCFAPPPTTINTYKSVMTLTITRGKNVRRRPRKPEVLTQYRKSPLNILIKK